MIKASFIVPFFVLLAISTFLHTPHLFSSIGDLNYDFFLHYNWGKEFAENLLNGDSYPRWIFHGRYGMGEPVFITYSPLYYYFIAFFKYFGFDTWVAMQLVELITNFAFSWFIYLAAKVFVNWKYALIIACVAFFNPFLVMLHYKFQGFAWGGPAYMTHGMMLWAITREKASENKYFNSWAAIAIGLAVGAHIISALINLICYSFYALAQSTKWAEADRIPYKWGLLKWGITVIIGLLLSAAYLFPALYYLDIMNADSWAGSYRLISFAWPVITLLQGEAQWISIQWPISVPALLMFILSVAYFIKMRKSDLGNLSLPLFATLLVCAASIFFASELSYPIWTFQNPISQINLPYRFVSVTYTSAAFAIGIALYHAHLKQRKVWKFLIIAAMGTSCLFALGALYKGNYIDGKAIPLSVIQDKFTFEDVKKKFNRPNYFELCKQNKAECVESYRSAAGYRGVAEYELKWAGPDYKEFAQNNYEKYCAEKDMICQEPERYGSGMKFKIITQQDTSVILPIFYYPAWKLLMHGHNIPITFDNRTGLVLVDLPRGENTFELVWSKTKIEVIGLYISLVTIVFFLVYGLYAMKTNIAYRRKQNVASSQGLK